MIPWHKRLRSILIQKVFLRNHQIGAGFHAGRQVFFYSKNPLKIGRNFYIGRYSEIGCDAEIGDNVIFANFVALVGRYDHHYQKPRTPIRLAPQIRDDDYNWKGLGSKVIIENDVWVGYGARILSGVTIGKGSIIAAGSVVTKDVAPLSIYGGVPARRLGPRFSNTEDELQHLAYLNEEQ
ncbi:MAG: acyltransferase [Puniceicoccales bacterium]